MSATTQILAHILGAYILIAGVSLLIQQSLMAEIVARLRDDRALTWMIAAFELLAGLILVGVHYDWSSPVAGLITLIGWLAVFEGALLMLAGRRFISLIAPLTAGKTGVLVWSGLCIVLGVLLLGAALTGWTGA